MVIGVSSHDLHIGKRKAWLEEGDAFFGWQLLRPELARACRAFFDAFANGSGTLYLYGELFGGHYPHADVRPFPGMSAVQTGVWYAPDMHWALFDAVHVSESQARFIAADEVTSAARRAGVLTPPVLARGRKNDVLDTAVRFPTRVPAIFGLPAIEGNFAEGIVVKADGVAAATERGIIKRKIEEFDEQRLDESEAWDASQRLPMEALRDIAVRLVNEARVVSAASKVGRENRDALLDEIAIDVLIDLAEAFPAAMAAIGTAAEDELREVVRAGAARLSGSV